VSPPASLFRLFASRFLHVPTGQHTPQQFFRTCQCGNTGLYRLSRPLPSHGPGSPTALPTFSVHTRAESRILGAKRLGITHSSRPHSCTVSVVVIFSMELLLISRDWILLDAKRFGASFSVDPSGVSSSSRGLVGDTSFAVLPNVKPIHTFLITISLQMIFLIKLWRVPKYKSFLTALTLCGYTSFLFGWHVHEKAVLLVLVPLR
jgi:hypothetical protein